MIIKIAKGRGTIDLPLELPATDAEFEKANSTLERICGCDRFRIVSVECPVSSLGKYIVGKYVSNPGVRKNLNTLVEKINAMNTLDVKTCTGALDLAPMNGLNDVLRVVDSLNEYIFIHSVTTKEELGRFLVDSGYKGFPENARPYLDYTAIGAEYCAEQGLEYPRETRKYVPRPASPSEAGLFYAQQPEQDALLGSVGHLRMDFGRGDAFWPKWFNHGSGELNTSEFKAEIDEVVNELRQTVLKDRATMRSFCADFGGELGESLGMRQYGYVVETEHYRYCLRCKPQEGDYDGYLWCFDKRVQELNMEQKEIAEHPPAMEMGGLSQ